MTASQSNPQPENGAFSKLIELLGKTIDFGKQALDAFKANPVTAATIASTILVPSAYIVVPPVYSTVKPQIARVIQSGVTSLQPNSSAPKSQVHLAVQDLDVKQQEVLNHFLDRTLELLEHKTIAIFSNQPNEKIRRLLQANAFTALRSLDSRGKGRFLRFLSEAELIKTNQPAIFLSGVDLREIDLQNAWLPEINLGGTYILNGKLKNVSLKRANLAGADLTGADLAGADLTDADLTHTYLTGANLTGADLTDADLPGADLTGANLTGVHLDVDKAIQNGANFCHATMPDGKPSTQPCP